MKNILLEKSALLLTFILIYATGATAAFKDQDYIDFGKAIADSVQAGNGAYLTASIDKDEFMNRIQYGEKGEKELPEDFMKGVRIGISSRFKFGEEIASRLGENGLYNFIKFYRQNGLPHIVFRLFGEDGLNYHDFEVVEKAGQLKLADCFVMVSGEKLSQTMRNIMFSFMADMENNDKGESLNDIQKLAKLKSHMAEKEYEEAEKLYETISEKNRKEKIFRLMGLMITVHTDQDKYLKLLNEYEKEFPKDPGLNLTMIDSYYLKGKYDKVRDCLDNLEDIYGEDPVLHFYRGNSFFSENNFSSAITYFKKATELKPDFEDAYNSWLASACEQGDFEEALRLADIMIYDFYFTREDLEMFFANYPDFIKSKEYKKWKKS